MESASVNGATELPNSRAGKQPFREEYSNANYPETAGEQEQDGPRGHDGKTFMEHAHEAIDEHTERGRFLA